MTGIKRLIGDKAFYKLVFTVTIPIIIQNGITNFVSLLDNIMVGRVGTEPMSGVSIANQLLFVFNLCIFGGLSGVGIFTAQFHGSHDEEGVRRTLRFKIIVAALICVIGITVFLTWGLPLINLYLQGDEDVGNVAVTAGYGLDYLKIMVLGLVPFALTQVYASTLRETGDTVPPMVASIISVITNMVLNYILIFGHLGFRPLGVEGAAIATVIARWLEAGYLVLHVHTSPKRYPYIRGAYRSLYVPKALCGDIIRRGMPLLANELLWSVGTTYMIQCYSLRGLSVIAALNISSTVSNFFFIAFQAMGSAVAILVGQQLGAGEYKEARHTAEKLIFFSAASCVVLGGVLALFAPYIPNLYNTSDTVRHLATKLLYDVAICMPIFSFAHCTYFTIRSGGKTVLTFLVDSAYTWLFSVPLVYVLIHFTDMNIVPLYLITQASDSLKCVIGFILVRKGVWVNNIVADKGTEKIA